MAEPVDSIISELIARDNGYRATFQAAIKVVDDHTAAIERNNAAEARGAGATEQAGKRRSSAAKTASDAEKAAARDAAAEVKRLAKERADAEREAARTAAAAIRAAEREKQAAATATARQAEKAAAAAAKESAAEIAAADAAVQAVNREIAARVRLAEVVDRGIARAQASGSAAAATNIGGVSAPGSRSSAARQTAIMRGATPAVPAAPVREVNYEALDRFDFAQRARVSTGEDRQALEDQVAYLRRIDVYRKAGLTDAEALTRVDRENAAIEQQRARIAQETAAAAKAQLAANANKTAGKVSLLAPTLVGGIGIHEVSELNDKYIELTNSLRVAGVGTAEFASIQGRLLATANRSGTDINALADVYRGAALASHDLGASQSDLLKITDAAANALRIQGRSSEEARGALLQLSHALESGRVTAREFNSLSLNLYPILQAVARGSDQYGGSVAKLRQALLDGGISSKEFFQALLRGSDDLEARASKATLTTAQGFNALRNSLTVYFGEADKAQGVSAALGAALQTLAANLDTLIPAIGAVATVLTVGYIARLSAAAIATQGLGAAILAAFGGPVGIAISAITFGLASFAIEVNRTDRELQQARESYDELHDRLKATTTQAGLAASGVAGVGTDALGAIPKVNSFAGAVGNLAQQLYNQARAARAARVEMLQKQLADGRRDELADAQKSPAGRRDLRAQAGSAFLQGDISRGASLLFQKVGDEGANILSGGRSDREAQQAYFLRARADQLLAKEIKQLQTLPITAADIPGGAPATGGISAKSQKQVDKLKADVAGLEQLAGSATGDRLDRIKRQIDVRNKKIADLEAGVSLGAASAAEGGGGRGRRGPSADTLARRAEAARLRGIRDDRGFDAALRQATSGELSAQADLTDDPAARAKVERDRIRFAAEQTAREIASKGPKSANGTGEYTAAEVKQLQGINTRTADFNIEKIDRDERRRVADEALNAERADLDNQRQALQSRQGLADTVAERRKIARDLLDLDYRQRELELKAIIAPDSKASKADQEIARTRLALLPGQKAADQKTVDRQNEGRGASYLRGLTPDRGEFIENEEVKALDLFNQGLDQSIAKSLHLHGILGSIVGDLIDMAVKQALIKPLAGALFGGGQGDGGGGLGGLFGSLLGAAKGFFGGGNGGFSSAVEATFGSGTVGSGGSISLGSLDIPGFASGGGGIIGGNPGIDQNLLSINGQPVARVGRGEQLSITPQYIAADNRRVGPSGGTTVVHQTIHVDGRNSVTPAGFADDILQKANGFARQAASRAGQIAVDAAPGAVRRVQTLGS